MKNVKENLFKLNNEKSVNLTNFYVLFLCLQVALIIDSKQITQTYNS